MYGPGYGSNPNLNAPPTFNNAAPPPHHNHNPHLQPGALSSQQPPQMYNPNQFAGGMPQGQQPSFPGAGQPNPAMMSGPGPAGMMQSTAMPQMPTNGQPNQMAYPNQQFQGNAAGQQFPPNYMAAGMPGFPANSNMNPQQQQQFMQQRMQQQHQQHHAQQQHQLQQHQQAQQQQHQQHQQQQHQQQQHQQQHQQQQHHHQQQQHHQQANQQPQHQQHLQQHQPQPNQMGMAGSPTPQRPPSASQGTPNHNVAQGQQSQHSTPQPAPQSQLPANQQQPSAAATPQTPTFPSNAQNPAVNGAPPAATPLSPGSVAKEQERMMVLLSINNELLYESIRMQQTLHELKEDSGPPEAGAAPSREEMMAQQDYNQCMRRLQGNLSYLATMVDRDRKPATLPPSPAYLTPPPLNMKIPVKSHPPGADEETKVLEPMVDREQRQKLMVELYTQLQGLYPGVDPKKEPTYNRAPGQKPGTAQASPVVTHSQGPPQTPTSATAP